MGFFQGGSYIGHAGYYLGHAAFVLDPLNRPFLEGCRLAQQRAARLVEERRRFWRTLQNLAGIDAAKLDEAHQAELDGLQNRYDEALAEIEALKGAATNAAE